MMERSNDVRGGDDTRGEVYYSDEGERLSVRSRRDPGSTFEAHQGARGDGRRFIFPDTLSELAAQHPDRLKVVHTPTRETDASVFGPSVRHGRVNEALLRELIPDPSECYAYLCGPGISKWDREAARELGTEPQPKFIETTLGNLLKIGVPNARIKRESSG
ncbi:MAG: hypothetical protein HYY76_07445 [Acidobacteria bacterium]|nr:hypothetical protein [Acidobacteriota bacterium]